MGEGNTYVWDLQSLNGIKLTDAIVCNKTPYRRNKRGTEKERGREMSNARRGGLHRVFIGFCGWFPMHHARCRSNGKKAEGI